MTPDELTSTKRHRQQCAENLRNALGDMSRTQFIYRLTAYDAAVTRQAVSYWLDGTCLPSPARQAAIADILDVPANDIFPALQLRAAS